jgi:hypothetical protein
VCSRSAASAMLQAWLRNRCSPTVATLVTEDADTACAENNLSLEQLLGAFARMPDGSVPFRSAQRHYTLASYAVRFVRGRSMGKTLLDPAGFDQQLSSAAAWRSSPSSPAQDDGDPLAALPQLRDAYDVPEALRKGSLDAQRWYKRYREALTDGVASREHSQLECPCVLMLVVSSTESSGDVMACFEELRSPRHLPLPYQRGQYDPSSPMILYVLLHDVCAAAARGIDHQPLLSRMRALYPSAQCRLLVINDLPPACPNNAQPDLWTAVCGGPVNPESGVRGRLVKLYIVYY